VKRQLPHSGFFGAQHRPLAPELSYWEILDHAMLLSDGRLEVGLKLTLPSLTFAPEQSLHSLMQGIRGLLRQGVAENHRLRVIAEAAPLPPTALEGYHSSLHTSNPAAALLHHQQVQQLERLRSAQLVQWRLHASLVTGRRTTGYTSRTPNDSLFRQAQRQRSALVAQANQAGFLARSLSGQEIFELCFRYFNPGHQEIALAPYQPTWQRFGARQTRQLEQLAPPTLRDQILKSAIHNTALDYLQIGGHFLGILSLASSPNLTQFNMVQPLLTLHPRAYFVVDYFHEPHDRALRRLRDTARMADAAAGSTEIYVDSDQQQAAEEAERMAFDTRKSGQHHFRVAANLILLSPTLEELRTAMSRALSTSSQIDGSPFKPLSYGLFAPFKHLAPFGGGIFPRQIAVLESNAADFFPLVAPWQTHHPPRALFETRWGSPLTFDPFHAGAANHNGLVVGGSGSGKSATAQRLIREFLKDETHQVFVVEPKSTYQHLTQTLGGTVLELAPGGAHRVNPLDLPPGQHTPSPAKLAHLNQILRAMVGSSPPQYLALENTLISQALRNAYAAQRQVLWGAEEQFSPPTLSQLVHALRSLEMLDQNPLSEEERKLAQQLGRRLEGWTGLNPPGTLLDGPTNLDLDAQLIFFDISGLSAYPGLDVVATLVLSELIYRRTEHRLQPTLVFLDEVWKLLAIPEAAALVSELFRLARARNTGIWAITQSLADFAGPLAQSILTNTTHHLVLSTPGEEDLIMQQLGLPAHSRWLLNLEHNRQQYAEALLFTRDQGRLAGDIVRIRLDPLERWLFSSTPTQVQQRQEQLNRLGPLLALQQVAGEA
jgi:conjugal transfer ATP-binding protein TraC